MYREIDKGRYGIITWEGIVEIIQRALYNQDNIESKEQRLLELIDENEFNKIWFTALFNKEFVGIKNRRKITIIDITTLTNSFFFIFIVF